MVYLMHIQQVFQHYKIDPTVIPEYNFCPRCAQPLIFQQRGGKKRPVCNACGFIHFHNPSPAVSILILQDDQILFGRRKGEPGRGLWALPSGYIEYEDNFITAAVREAKEETGLDVKLTTVINVVSSFYSPRFHFLGVYLAACVVGGTLEASDDLEEVSWFPKTGPLPNMAFQEDLEAIRLLRLDPSHGLAVDHLHNTARREGGWNDRPA